MKITEQEVRYVANLANLKITDSETLQLANNLDEILAHMDRLGEIDTEGVEPMSQVLLESESETASLREDKPRPTLGNEAALANAPLAAHGYFKVPLVIER